ncbi:excisionase family DNA-binding protein [Boudabousia marimammalium]|uniref:Helix-turn-helix domain-containing protein n=1 Tax=Boudabousia marimammalium TaxID=156892 RepID=A0A1Q5PME9_9ACTO|nr:excisionase family DNA-binding protein [Boudabousia marimammalium]OKL48702.1 hypothetical protein BM477_05770 [Boudabousia marimammalium]
MSEPDGPQFATVSEVAGVLRVSQMTVYRMIQDGTLPAIRAGRSFQIPRGVVEQLKLRGVGDWVTRRDTVIGQ